jgi:hypothetical protein
MARILPRLCVAGLVLATCALSATQAVAQTPLRWKFTSGQSLHYTATYQSTSRSSNAVSVMTTVVNVVHKVDSVDAATGTATITQTIERIRGRIDSEANVQNEVKREVSEYDTDNPKEPAGLIRWMGAAYHAVLKQPVTFKMSARGQISELNIPKPKLEEIERVANGDQLAAFFNASGISSMLGLLVLPETEVLPGSRWQQTNVLKNAILGHQSTEMDVAYQGVEDRGGTPVAKFAAVVRTSFIADPNQQMNVLVEREKSQATFSFDAAAGRMVEAEQASQMSLKVSFRAKTIRQQSEKTQQVRLDPAGTPEKTAAVSKR